MACPWATSTCARHSVGALRGNISDKQFDKDPRGHPSGTARSCGINLGISQNLMEAKGPDETQQAMTD